VLLNVKFMCWCLSIIELMLPIVENKVLINLQIFKVLAVSVKRILAHAVFERLQQCLGMRDTVGER